MKSISAGAALLALLLPLAAQGAEGVPKLGELTRCAGVYNASSETAADGSEAKLLATRRFLQNYLILIAMAERDKTDTLTLDLVNTLYKAEAQLARTDITLAKAEGNTAPLFTADFAKCDTLRAAHPKLFAVVDEQIDALVKGKN